MPYELNSKLNGLVPYDPIQGNYKIRLDANESFFNLTDDVMKKLSIALSEISFNRYPDPYASAVVNAFAEYYGINPDYVTAGNGSDELISIITSCFLEKGDKVLTLKPDFSMYAFYGSLYETEVMTLPKNSDLSVDVDKIADCCNSNNIKAVIFSNPCNPTSLGICREDMIRLLNSVKCLVILDEAYMDFWCESLLNDISDYDNMIILKTCSKALGLAAIRLGFAVAGKKITTALRAAKSPYNCDTVSQTIGKVILAEKDMLKLNLSEIIESRDWLYTEMLKLVNKSSAISAVYPTVTNFVFVKSDNAKYIYDELLKRSIAIRFMGDYLRITAGCHQENKELIENIGQILETIN